jgi:glycosyltransferase involved in cell wall biosynthesis
VRSFRPNILHAHSFFAGLIVRALVEREALAGVSVVYCPHGWAFSRKTSPISHWASTLVELALQDRADQIHCVSQHELQAGARAGLRAEKMFCLPNRIPDMRYGQPSAPLPAFSPNAKLRVAFVGRLDVQKGFDVLLRAAQMLPPGVEIAVAGTAAVNRAFAFKPAANMRMLGWLSPEAADALIRAADVVVAPSRWEGLPIVGLEAMRAGKALVASRVDGFTELVDDQLTGLLTPSGDAQALCAALSSLDRTRALAMGAMARRKFDLFYSFRDYTHALRWRYAALVSAQSGARLENNH